MLRLAVRLQELLRRLGFHREWFLILLGAVIGGVTAFAAVAFVELLHALTAGADQAIAATPIWLLPLLPMAGALLTGVTVHLFASEARGHGVPEVIDAVIRRGGAIRKRVAVVKAVTSAFTIGSGGSAGAEGPIVQIGSAIGSAVAQVLRISRDQVTTLVGCGAAAGIASVFNAPIAGVFFVLEILLRDFSLRTFTPIVIASVFSATVTQAIRGVNQPIFDVTALGEYVFTLPELPSYAVLGLVCGVVAVGFTRSLYAADDLASRVKVHPIAKPVLGAALLGLLGVGYLLLIGRFGVEQTIPSFFGNGYPAIVHLLDPANYPDAGSAAASPTPAESSAPGAFAEPSLALDLPTELWMLLLLLACKLGATCLTLGSGGSGGVFAPSLFLGATSGALFGVALQSAALLPTASSPAAYALVGMAALVAGTTHAPLTAFLIVFEITRDPFVLLPIMLAAVISTVVAQLLMRDSIYTLKLRRRGVLIGEAQDLTLLRKMIARQVPTVPHVGVHPRDPVSRLLELNRAYQVVDFVVVDDEGKYVGMVTGQDLRTALLEPEAIPLLLAEDLVRTNLPPIDPEETLDLVLEKFSRHDVSSLPITSGGDRHAEVIGLLTRTRLMQRYQKALRGET